MSKQIYNFKDIKADIFTAIDTLTDPIRQTLGPKGGNVLFEDDEGTQFVTNDGVTIARNINVSNEIQNAIIQTIKHSALRTNTEAGDGTSTTTLLSSILIKGGINLVEGGINRMTVKKEFIKYGKELKVQLRKQRKLVKSNKDIRFIANIAANNDSEIAENVVKTIAISGEHGHVMIEPSFSGTTNIKEDSGFILNSGMVTPELSNQQGVSADYRDVPVLVTDKRLYYAEEAETILNTCLTNGYDSVVIVAADFVGKALPVFVANHTRGTMNVLLVKDGTAKANKGIIMEDLSTYLGGAYISERSDSIVDNLKIEDFIMAKRVYADGIRTVLTRDSAHKNIQLGKRIKALKAELKKVGDKESLDYKNIELRLSSLTSGMVTVEVSGSTAIEIREKIYRYEDSINAAKVAVRDGYLPGGGLALFNANRSLRRKSDDFSKLFNSIGESTARQLAVNAGEYEENVLEKLTDSIGYNALTGEYEDLVKVGIIDPYKVTEMAIDNSISIASQIVSSGYLIINHKEDDKSKTKNS